MMANTDSKYYCLGKQWIKKDDEVAMIQANQLPDAIFIYDTIGIMLDDYKDSVAWDEDHIDLWSSRVLR